MFEVENLTVNDGNLPTGDSVSFDLKIPGKWCKICYIKIVQLQGGATDILFEIWESTAARTNYSNRSYLYRKPYSRNITLTDKQGGEYAESLMQAPIPYRDFDTVDEEKTYAIHCRLENLAAGTASDFAVHLKLADIGENV